jgi:hypothetical protein
MNDEPDEPDLDEFLDEVFVETTKLRYKGVKVTSASTLNDVMNEQIEVKSRLDVIEDYLLRLWRLRERARRAVSAAKAIRTDKWDKAIVGESTGMKTRLGDFQTGKERESNANLSVLEFTREVRVLEEQESKVHEAYEYVRTIQFGLNATRQDLRDMVRTFQPEPYQWRKR